uniref:DUF5726 domain-containing protein n=1 Tax=Taenia asiatica TaxID=60517 RepID=A0A0R3W3X6_TAEAS
LLLLHALPQELFLAAINAGVTPDFDIDHCCEILSQLAINQRERSLARVFPPRPKGVHPPTIAARLNAMKTNDFNQLVKAAIRKRQELLLTPAPQAAHRRPNPPRSRWIPSRQTPRAGGAYYSLSCQPPNAPRPFLQALGKLEGYLCRFLLDSGGS